MTLIQVFRTILSIFLFFLSLNLLAFSFSMQSEMIPTKFGFKIENFCFEELGADLVNIVEETVSEGLRCLLDLSHTNIGPPGRRGSAQNASSLNALLSSEDKVSIVCSEQESNFKRKTTAHGSSSVKTKNILNRSIKHPYISLNFKYKDSFTKSMKGDQSTIKRILFHELMHNLGYSHDGRTIEYAYTCDICCFSPHDDKEKQYACKICQGNYRDHLDLEYLKDLFKYVDVETFNMSHLGSQSAKEYIKKNPGEPLGLILLAQSYRKDLYSIGYYIGLRVKRSQMHLSLENSKELNKVSSLRGIGRSIPLDIFSRKIADALFEVYYNQDLQTAIDVIYRKKKIIKDSMEQMNKKGCGKEKCKYMGRDIHRTLKLLLYDLLLDKDLKKNIIEAVWINVQVVYLIKYFFDEIPFLSDLYKDILSIEAEVI